VTLIFEDGTKKRIELYNRPPVIDINLRLDNGDVIEGLHFVRNGPDSYRQGIFGKDKKDAEKGH
jgi:hypothetical protein